MYINTDHDVKEWDCAKKAVYSEIKKFLGPCEGRTHDLGVISTTLCRLS